jgi:glyoxylase-like metal-dependent hydrolase (beta-lactamase superfamily II)
MLFLLRALFFLLPLLLGACQSLPQASSAPPLPRLVPIQVAPGVYYFRGALEDVSPENQGVVGNVGFIVGPSGVTVIDTGSSYRRGQAILQGIREVTDQPVKAVIVTHAVREFLFGNGAFAEQGIPIMAGQDAIELMRDRCNHCLEQLNLELGEASMAGTRLVLPDQPVTESLSLEIGGRSIGVVFQGWASGPGDLVVLDRFTGTLFTGFLVQNGRIPAIRDAHVDQWIRSLNHFLSLPPRAIVPGYGDAMYRDQAPRFPLILAEQRRYLMMLDHQIAQTYSQGKGLAEVVEIGFPDFKSWAGYPRVHRENLHYGYLQKEKEDLNAH